MSGRHIPGPYEPNHSGTVIWALNEDGHNRITIQIDGGYVRNGERTSAGEVKATSDLLIAAPALLEALIAAAEYENRDAFYTERPVAPWYEAAVLAIIKAEDRK